MIDFPPAMQRNNAIRFDELTRRDGRIAFSRLAMRSSLRRKCDDIIANHDRHWRNFGIVRNVETLACRPAPLFDSGSSLWCDVETSVLAKGERSFKSSQFYESPAKQMLLVDDLEWFDVAALDGFVDEAMGILSANDALAARIPHLRAALEWRVERMRGIAAWG